MSLFGKVRTAERCPTFEINLDEDDITVRYAELYNCFKRQFGAAVRYLHKFLDEAGSLAGILQSTVATLLKCSTHAVYIHEMHTLSEMAGISFNDMIALNSLYELCAACSTFVDHVYDDKGVPRPVMGRNMDWDASFLSKMSVHMKMFRGGKLLYEHVTFAGYLGVLTACKPGSYAVAVNFRLEANLDTTASVCYAIGKSLVMTGTGFTVGFLVRSMLEGQHGVGANTYEEACAVLSKAPLIAPCYFTICGAATNEGCVLTRRRTGLALPARHMMASGHRAHQPLLYQANIDDTWEDPIETCTSAQKLAALPDVMDSLSRIRKARKEYAKRDALSLRDFAQMCNTFPIRNEVTIYMTVMDPGDKICPIHAARITRVRKS
jgi:hypothetical protein